MKLKYEADGMVPEIRQIVLAFVSIISFRTGWCFACRLQSAKANMNIIPINILYA